MPRRGTFDRLARGYRALEFLAFGRELERARFAFVDRLRDCESVLLLGEGDGRFLAQLVDVAPQARIHCVDASAAMLARARSRVAGSPALARVTFEQADARNVALPAGRYDAVTTIFFLDCFQPTEVEHIAARVSGALKPDATWLFADFVLPGETLRRWRARAWLAVLYAFFRWQAGLAVSALPPSEAIIVHAGFRCVTERTLQAGLLRSAVFARGEKQLPATAPRD